MTAPIAQGHRWSATRGRQAGPEGGASLVADHGRSVVPEVEAAAP